MAEREEGHIQPQKYSRKTRPVQEEPGRVNSPWKSEGNKKFNVVFQWNNQKRTLKLQKGLLTQGGKAC